MPVTRLVLFLLVLFLLAVVAASVLTLGFGPEAWLMIRLPGGLPFGTLLAILAFVAAAAVPFVLSPPRSLLRWVSVAALVASAAWFPVGVALAGNVDLNFFNDARDSALFHRVTVGTAALVLGTTAWAFVSALRRRARGFG